MEEEQLKTGIQICIIITVGLKTHRVVISDEPTQVICCFGIFS